MFLWDGFLDQCHSHILSWGSAMHTNCFWASQIHKSNLSELTLPVALPFHFCRPSDWNWRHDVMESKCRQWKSYFTNRSAKKKHSKYSSAGIWGSWHIPFCICLSLLLAGILPWGWWLLYQPYWCPDVGLRCAVSLKVHWGQSQATQWLRADWSLVPRLVCVLSPQDSWPRGAISLEISSCTQPIIDGRASPMLYFNPKTQMQAAIQT